MKCNNCILLHLYSIIKPYNSFFVINRHIARQDFILNDMFLNLNKNNKQSLKMYPGTQQRIRNVKYNKTITALHFVQYDVLWSSENQYCFSVLHSTSYCTQ